MQAFTVEQYGGAIGKAEVGAPAVGEHDVLVRIEASGLNQLDERIRTGDFKLILPFELPVVLGNDFAGTVVETGPAVTTFEPGDRVWARPDLHRPGTLAELIAVDESVLARMPETLGFADAAALPLTALTAWQAFVELGDVQPGQLVLIHGGAGAVGTVAIQIAKHLGARVATTASAADAEFLRGLGADVVIDYRTEDFTERVRDVDLVLDILGGENLLRSLRVLRPGGLAVGIAGPPDPAFARAIGANPALRLGVAALSRKVRSEAKRHGVRYSFLFVRADGAQLARIAELVDAGALRPFVGKAWPFEEAAAALDAMARGARGKQIVLVGSAERGEQG
ncbi:NADP-dependent oxidoreductase [Agromyces seonyuensis]|uniref:Zinc-binding dehydrogenase n=1 Tax=Agromyces seonyuensis TaxID=2662446 RepID=A0A6I4NW99_9MICO|nr:NADP-dependent oxidoreductase [Agromyces seonyuensis]MWB98411.1 zinc-binding dehydrogenase [Agromyces seonyuensis]